MIYVYTDASFNKDQLIAVTGFVLFSSEQEHDTTLLSVKNINFRTIKENNNIRAELLGAIFGLEACSKGDDVTLYTDCQTVIDLPKRRRNLEESNYISKNKGTRLANADLYERLFDVMDQIVITLIWVKGHSRNKKNDPVQTNFSHLDKQVRKALRAIE